MKFDELKYDISQLPADELVIDKFPILATYKELADPENDLKLRICIFAHHDTSPFVKQYREDYDQRLTKIFEYMEIDDLLLFDAISKGIDPVFEDMVNRLMMESDNLAYVMWSNKLNLFHKLNSSLRLPINSDNILVEMDKRTKLDAALKKVYEDLIDYEEQVFPDIPTRKKLRKSISKLIQPAEKYAQQKSVI